MVLYLCQYKLEKAIDHVPQFSFNTPKAAVKLKEKYVKTLFGKLHEYCF